MSEADSLDHSADSQRVSDAEPLDRSADSQSVSEAASLDHSADSQRVSEATSLDRSADSQRVSEADTLDRSADSQSTSKADVQDHSATSQSISKADSLTASPRQTVRNAGEVNSTQSKQITAATSQADSLVAAVQLADHAEFVDVKVRCQAGRMGLTAVLWLLAWHVQ